MKISFVVAMAKNNCIGKDNDLPWYLPEDLKHFKKITEGGTVLMGRKTFESIMSRNSKPLPNRTNVVLTRNEDYKVPDGVLLFHDVDQALQNLDCEELFVMGGGSIYKLFMDRVDKIYMTHIEKEINGDVFFPEIDFTKWKKVKEKKGEGFSFVDYERI